MNIVRTAKDDLKGIARMMLGPSTARATSPPKALALVPTNTLIPAPAGQFVHFAGVGARIVR